jgi:ATP-binding cassette subfamily D (ALD) protein 3
MFVKYGAVIIAYAVLGLPVFGPKRQHYLGKVGNDASTITHDYIRNFSLIINLAKAIGRIVVSYKDMQNLAGFTTRVEELDVVLEDLQKGKYVKTLVEGAVPRGVARGQIIETDDVIIFEDVPVITPNGDVLIERLNFEIRAGMHVFIQGPNGCGKSSLFRILGELWPLFDGKLYKPKVEQLFYIPQRPYLPSGTLRDQIIYPHTPAMMAALKITDNDLMQMLELVELHELFTKRGGLDSVEDWGDSLSGGQKQRVAMCRLLYHKPKFAILDECTSSMSVDAEAAIYQHYKNVGITLFTVSHRLSLVQFHTHLLKFDGNGAWSFSKLVES